MPVPQEGCCSWCQFHRKAVAADASSTGRLLQLMPVPQEGCCSWQNCLESRNAACSHFWSWKLDMLVLHVDKYQGEVVLRGLIAMPSFILFGVLTSPERWSWCQCLNLGGNDGTPIIYTGMYIMTDPLFLHECVCVCTIVGFVWFGFVVFFKYFLCQFSVCDFVCGCIVSAITGLFLVNLCIKICVFCFCFISLSMHSCCSLLFVCPSVCVYLRKVSSFFFSFFSPREEGCTGSIIPTGFVVVFLTTWLV